MRLFQEPGSEFNLKRERSLSREDFNQAKQSPVCDEWMQTKDGKYLKVNCMDILEYMFHILNRRSKNNLAYNFFFIMVLDAIIVYNYWSSYSYIFKVSLYPFLFWITLYHPLLPSVVPILYCHSDGCLSSV